MFSNTFECELSVFSVQVPLLNSVKRRYLRPSEKLTQGRYVIICRRFGTTFQFWKPKNCFQTSVVHYQSTLA